MCSKGENLDPYPSSGSLVLPSTLYKTFFLSAFPAIHEHTYGPASSDVSRIPSISLISSQVGAVFAS